VAPDGEQHLRVTSHSIYPTNWLYCMSASGSALTGSRRIIHWRGQGWLHYSGRSLP
jgi:hypothetical protein